MKILYFFILLIMMPILSSGSCKSQVPTDDDCDHYYKEVKRVMMQYQESKDPLLLDSVIIFLNKIDCDKYVAAIGIYKAIFYYEKGSFSKAIESIKSIPDTLTAPLISKQILIWELEYKWAISDGDRDREIAVYKQKDAVLRDMIDKNWAAYEAILQTIVEQVRIDKSEATIVIEDYFHNRVKFMDNEIVLSEIDSMRNAMKGTDVFFEGLKHYVSGDPGYNYYPDFF